jgi:ubiquinone/menaquinone biosynthesis C-methylase UbiE
MAANALRPAAGEFESRLASVRAHSASCGAARVRRALLDRLAVEKRDRVLELGFGSGRLLFAVAARASDGLVAGVEPEEYALRHASRRCERLVREGRVALLRGTSRDLSAFATGAFDKVYGVHVTHFWDDPLPHLREIRRVLRPGGHLLLGSCAGEPFEQDLVAAGFREIRTEAGRPAWTSAH